MPATQQNTIGSGGIPCLPFAEALEHLMAAWLDDWNNAHFQLIRQQAVQQQLLNIKHFLEALVLDEEETLEID